MEYPLVSVVTPSYNTAQYIESTLLSVATQDYPNIEHIVFDGGSKDGTIEILEKFPKVDWVSEPDKGQSDALNKGFKKAKGKYIGWLNSDDLYTEGAIKKAVDYLESHPDVAMIYTDLNIIDEKDNIYGFTKGMEFSLQSLLENNPVKQPTLLMRREVIDELKGVDVNLHFVMDRELWLRMEMKGYIIKYLPGWVNASFRLVEGTKTFEYTPKFRQEWYEVMLAAFKTEPYFEKVDKAIMNNALAVNRSAYHLSLMNSAFIEGKRSEGINHAIKAYKANGRIKRNPGFYRHFLMGFLGLIIDRTKKFKD